MYEQYEGQAYRNSDISNTAVTFLEPFDVFADFDSNTNGLMTGNQLEKYASIENTNIISK
jgi:hypothetical protein